MRTLHESAASTGFYGDDLDPAELTIALAIEPTVGVRAGEPRRTVKGAEKIAQRGSWRIRAEHREPGELDSQINELLDRMSDDFQAWRQFSERYRGRVFCGLFMASGNEGVTLRSKTLGRLAERGLLIDFDIYAPGGDE